MTENDKILFNLLKQKVAATFLKHNAASSSDISKWKGDDIIAFQEDLLQKVKARVSEKWFYNYFRNDIQKLPRIDMLNLLSEYTGYKNWVDFSQKNSRKVSSNKSFRKYLLLALIVVVVLLVGFVVKQASFHQVQICFVNEAHHPISDLEVVEILPDESEKYLKIQDNCVKFLTNQTALQFKIHAPYYKDKVIHRKLDNDNYKETIVLQNDLLSLMLRRYSSSDTQHWDMRKKQLEDLINDKAVIYQQWFGSQKGIEVYSKEAFIEQLCIPTSLIKNMEILSINYRDSKIVNLRFSCQSIDN